MNTIKQKTKTNKGQTGCRLANENKKSVFSKLKKRKEKRIQWLNTFRLLVIHKEPCVDNDNNKLCLPSNQDIISYWCFEHHKKNVTHYHSMCEKAENSTANSSKTEKLILKQPRQINNRFKR